MPTKTTRTTERELPNGDMTWIEHQDDGQARRTRIVTGKPWTEVVYNCRCCSCDKRGEGLITPDPACRLHGFAAKRPCDLHKLDGEPWGSEAEGTELFGKMPDPVYEVIRARNATFDEVVSGGE